MKLYGKNPVIERLRSNPQSIRQIFVEQGHQDHGFIAQKAKKWGIPVSAVPASQLLKIARNVNTQGIVANVDDFSYMPYDELLNMACDKHLSMVFLDGVTDPQNLGVILRTLGCLGGFTLVLPTKDSVSVTEAVLRVASGGENYVRIAQVSNLAQAIAKAKDAGFWIAGSIVEDGESIIDAQLQFPLALVLGSEQKGIREVIKKHVDAKLTIPMAQNKMSYNVAQAATIFAYEITKQRNK